MKRDLDILRKFLLAVEAKSEWGGVWAKEFPVDGVDANVVGYHALLAAQAGFLTCEKVTSSSTPERVYDVMIFDLSWPGHEYLDTIRDEEIWRKTKIGAKKTGNASFEFVIEIAKSLAKSALKDTGLPI